MLENQFKKEPVPVFFSENGVRLIDGDIINLSVRRLFALSVYMNMVGRDKLINPPSKTGTISGGTLSLSFTEKCNIMGFRFKISGGDQTPLGNMTFALAWHDSKGTALTQQVTVTTKERESFFYWLIGSIVGDVVYPVYVENGKIVLTAETPSYQTINAALTITGSTGLTIIAEALTSKHPEVLRLLSNSDLYERLIRVTLDKGQQQLRTIPSLI